MNLSIYKNYEIIKIIKPKILEIFVKNLTAFQ